MLSIRSLSYVNPTRLRKVCSSLLNKSMVANVMNRAGCGNREVVGFGRNGVLMYADHTLTPFPAIRFREDTPELLALREKERGDWRRLTIEEKKYLYRASFCQTFAEIEAPTGEWKSVLAVVVLVLCSGFWILIFQILFVFTEAPASFSEASRAVQYWRLEAINNQPFSGNYKPPNADKYKPVTEESNGKQKKEEKEEEEEEEEEKEEEEREDED